MVCYAAPADVLLPVCGHVALCGACCSALELRARLEGNAAAACPVCRAPLRHVMLPAPAQSGCYVPPQPRPHALLRLCAGEQGVESLFSQRAASDAVGADDAEDLRSRDVVHRALHALDAFAEHSGEQMALALRDGAVDAVCRAMCVAPLCPNTQMIGSNLLFTLASDSSSAALRAACERTRAHDVVLHALRCMHDGTATEAMRALIMLLRAVPPRRWLGRQAAAVARLTCRMRTAYAGSGHMQHLPLAMLVQIVMVTRDTDTRTMCVLEAARTMQRAMEGEADIVCAQLALKLLHVALVQLKTKTFRRGGGIAAHAALCASALQAGVVPALLAVAAQLCAQEGEDNAQRCAVHLLPVLQEVCMASPAALRDAVSAGMMPVLAQLLDAHEDSAQLSGAVCELLAHIFPPPTACVAAAAHDDNKPDPWQAVRSDAFAAATAAQIMAHVADAAFICIEEAEGHLAAIMSDASADDLEKDDIFGAACVAMDAAAQALTAYAGMLAHGAPAAWAEEVAVSCFQLCKHGVFAAVAFSCLEMYDGSEPVGTCKLRNLLHRAACCAMSALMRKPPLAAASEEEGADAAESIKVRCAHVVHIVLANVPQRNSCSCAGCDATQAAACALLAHLAVACCGSTAAVQSMMVRALSASSAMCAPIATRLTAITQQTRLPALRREALRTLALLLAMHVSTPAAAADSDAFAPTGAA